MENALNCALARLAWLQFATWLALSLGLAACGGSNDDAGSQVGQAGAAAASKVFSDRTAGKACAADKDCGNGTCKKELPVNSVLGVAGTVSASGGYCSFECGQSADCGEGGVCMGLNAGGLLGALGAMPSSSSKGLCLARCDANSQCREGYRCADVNGSPVNDPSAGAAPSNTAAGACQVAPATDKVSGAAVGNACSADAECDGGRCAMSDTTGAAFPGGYCTGRCLTDADCGERALCDPGAAGALGLGSVNAGTCYRSCAQDGDCGRDGYRCRSGAGGAARRCIPGSKPLPDGTVGKACAADGECGGAAMSCVTQMQVFNASAFNGMMVNAAQLTSQLGYPGGYCSQRCVEDIDCGAGGSCVGGLGAFGGAYATGTCFKRCGAASDCREGYSCGSQGLSGMLPAGAMPGSGAAAPSQTTVCFVQPPAAGADAGVE